LIVSLFELIVRVELLPIGPLLVRLVHVIGVRLRHVPIIRTLRISGVVSVIHVRVRLVHVVRIARLLVACSVVRLWLRLVVADVSGVRVVGSVRLVYRLNWRGRWRV
jgi:hypothetical protein